MYMNDYLGPHYNMALDQAVIINILALRFGCLFNKYAIYNKKLWASSIYEWNTLEWHSRVSRLSIEV